LSNNVVILLFRAQLCQLLLYLFVCAATRAGIFGGIRAFSVWERAALLLKQGECDNIEYIELYLMACVAVETRGGLKDGKDK
jgi:hypothetical protein